MLMISSTSLYFIMRSLAVVEVMEGDAFTCNNNNWGSERSRKHQVKEYYRAIILKIKYKKLSLEKSNTQHHLNHPRFELVVDDDVVAVALKAVSVGGHDGRDSFQGMNYKPSHVRKELIRARLASRAL